MTLTFLLAAVVPAGLALTLLGLRGRRVDDHPLCRRCGFDLFGNPDAAVCTECGADLSRRKAVKVGNRRRRTRVLTAGLALLVPAALVLGLVAWGAASGVDWQRHKPLGWLRYELDASNPATADAAARELLRREGEASLGEGVWLDLTAAGLRAQADPAGSWYGTIWPDVLGTALDRRLMTRQQRTSYTTTALGMNPAGPATRPAAPDTFVEYRTASGDDGLRLTRLDGLDAATTAAVVERALTIQGDADVFWIASPWPVLLRAALDSRLLNDAQRRRYLTNALPLNRATRRVVRRGDPFAFKLSPGTRAAEGDEVLAVVDWLGVEAAGETLLSSDDPPRHQTMLVTDLSAGGWQPWNLPAHTADWPLGEATAVGRFRLQIGRNPPPVKPEPPEGVFPGTPEVDAEVTLRETFLVVDPDDPRSWLVTDPDKRAAMDDAVVASPVVPSATSPGYWEVNLRLREPFGDAAAPVPIYAYVSLRSGGREVRGKISPVYLFGAGYPSAAGSGTIGLAWPTESRGPEASLRRVDVILRPAVELHATRPENIPIWGREIVIRDVPVYHDRPPARNARGDITEWYGVGGRADWKAE